jgi:hypothetical protein
MAIAGEAHASGTASEPRLFPEPGVFAGDIKVRLRCDTPGAVIHYTFDGSQPLAGSPVYDAPISVKGTALNHQGIRERAWQEGQRSHDRDVSHS